MRPSDFLYFPRNERRVMLLIVILIVAVAGWFYYAGKSFDTTDIAASDTLSHKGRMAERKDKDGQQYGYYRAEGKTTELFQFDPNTADSTQLLRLGLSPWQVRNIYRYRAKGGVYRDATDFARLYGLTAKKFRELRPYIRISDDYKPAAEVYAMVERREVYVRDTMRYPLKLLPGQQIVLNTADTTTLRKVPGIGTGWARAIINYGNRLGGYCRVSQLKEIEGFPEDALPYFKVINPNPRKLKVNKASLGRLRSHPYINFFQAKAIRDYVRLHGPIKNIRELSLLPDFPPSEISRMEPYIEY